MVLLNSNPLHNTTLFEKTIAHLSIMYATLNFFTCALLET